MIYEHRLQGRQGKPPFISGGNYYVYFAAVAVGLLLSHAISDSLVSIAQPPPPLSTSAGFAIVMLHLLGARYWSAIAMGSIAWTLGSSIEITLIRAVASPLVALAGAWVLQRISSQGHLLGGYTKIVSIWVASALAAL
jgi:hypothetical protein